VTFVMAFVRYRPRRRYGEYRMSGRKGRPWMWASGHNGDIRPAAAQGYEATREAALASFAKNWRLRAFHCIYDAWAALT
jgi:hypothetical protein